MKLAFLNVLRAIPPILIDGTIVALIAFLTFWGGIFGGDEAGKYIAPWLLFWLKASCGSVAITLVAIQSFRSKLFAEHSARKEAGHTEILTKPTP